MATAQKLEKKLLIVKGHVPRQYGISRQREKGFFIHKLESLRLELQATPFIENTRHEQPEVEGSVGENKRKFQFE